MSQHSFVEPNEAGAAYRAGINNALQALASRSSGASAPATTYAYQPWCDTTNGVLKQRNAANSAWIIRDTLAETRVISRSSNTILGIGDYGCTFLLSSTFTQTITAAATLADGWHAFIRNNGSGVITLDPNASETIDGGTTLVLNPGEGCRISCNGTIFSSQGLNSIPPFESEQTIAVSTDLNVAHGLGRLPTRWSVVIRNKTAELGYSIGDEVPYTKETNSSSYVNATVIGCVVTATPTVVSRATHGNANITVANWKFVFRAW
jgi:hypothetical protein